MDHSILTVSLISSPADITIGYICTKIWILQEIVWSKFSLLLANNLIAI